MTARARTLTRLHAECAALLRYNLTACALVSQVSYARHKSVVGALPAILFLSYLTMPFAASLGFILPAL